MYRRTGITTSRRTSLGAACEAGLTENNHDVLDEVVNCGEDLGAAFDCHSGDNKQGEYKPRDETNNGRIADEQTRIGGGEFDQTPDSAFNPRRVVTAEKC